MPIHAAVASRFHYLDGLTSMGAAYSDPVLIQQIRQFETWDAAEAPPAVHTRSQSAPGPHGPVPVRIYSPSAEVPVGAPCLVWLHGGGFIGGDLDMHEADWTAREVCVAAGAVVVSVDYRLAVGGVCYPVPHDDTVAAVTWVRDRAEELGVDPARITIGGASAGGNLTAGAAVRLRDRDGWAPALTNVASALRDAPDIASRLTLIWIGGSLDRSAFEYNCDTDQDAAAVVLDQPDLAIHQFPLETYRRCAYSVAELELDLSSCGLLGHWLWSHFTNPPDWVRVGGVWPLGDSPAVLVTALSAESSTATLLPAEGSRGAQRRVHTDLDFRLIVADMLARFRLHERHRSSREPDLRKQEEQR